MIKLHDLTRRGFLNAAGIAGGSLLLPGGAPLAQPARALPPVSEEEAVLAFAHIGPTSDEGWTWAHHHGVDAVRKAFPRLKRVMEIESVPYSADATRTFKRFVREGAHLVVSSGDYGDLLYEVSDKAPKTGFVECNGRSLRGNLGWYYLAHWMPAYIVGVAAGLLTKTNKLGYVASLPVPAVFGNVNAFHMGARSVNAKVSTQVVVINSWFDPQAAAQAGTALIDSGADFLMGIMDEAAYLKVAERRGVWAAMWNTDVRRYGPNSYVTSILVDFDKFYIDQVARRLAGQWSPGSGTLLELGAGVDRDAWGARVPKSVAAQADAVRARILDGSLHPFAGPIKDSEGRVRVNAAETMSTTALYNWDWAVSGVSGLQSTRR